MKLRKAFKYKVVPFSSKGFTLIEIMMMIGIFAIIMSFGLAIGVDTYRRTIFDSERMVIVSLLQKARNRSMNNINETVHGVIVDNTNGYKIFEGNPPIVLQTIPKSGIITISPSPTITVTFDQLSGSANPTSIEMSDGVKSDVIEINDAGGILW